MYGKHRRSTTVERVRVDGSGRSARMGLVSLLPDNPSARSFTGNEGLGHLQDSWQVPAKGESDTWTSPSVHIRAPHAAHVKVEAHSIVPPSATVANLSSMIFTCTTSLRTPDDPDRMIRMIRTGWTPVRIVNTPDVNTCVPLRWFRDRWQSQARHTS
jgi:hypothetical protein